MRVCSQLLDISSVYYHFLSVLVFAFSEESRKEISINFFLFVVRKSLSANAYEGGKEKIVFLSLYIVVAREIFKRFLINQSGYVVVGEHASNMRFSFLKIISMAFFSV